jgi:hypothetical protein
MEKKQNDTCHIARHYFGNISADKTKKPEHLPGLLLLLKLSPSY